MNRSVGRSVGRSVREKVREIDTPLSKEEGDRVALNEVVKLADVRLSILWLANYGRFFSACCVPRM